MFSSLRRFDIVPVLLRQRRLTLEDNHFTTWSIMRRHNLLLSGWPFKLETVKLRQLTDWLTDWLTLTDFASCDWSDWLGWWLAQLSSLFTCQALQIWNFVVFAMTAEGGKEWGEGNRGTSGEILEREEREEREECWGGVAAGVDGIAGHTHRAHQTPSPPYWLRQAVSSPSHSSDSGSDCTEILWR